VTFPISNSDFSGFPRTCSGCGERIAPTSKKGPPVSHWFETKNGEHLSWHFACKLKTFKDAA
jgi:hypothetical protein